MFSKKFLIILFLILSFSISKVYAIESIVYFDVNFIMGNSLVGKSMSKQLNEIYKSNVEKYKVIAKEIKKKEDKIVAQKNVLEKNEFQKKIDNLKKEISEYKSNSKKSMDELSKKRTYARVELLKILTPILKEYSKDNSISIIISKENIIMGKSELDITKNILEIIDAKIKEFKIQ